MQDFIKLYLHDYTCILFDMIALSLVLLLLQRFILCKGISIIFIPVKIFP